MNIYLPEDKQFFIEYENKRMRVEYLEILLTHDKTHISKQICYYGSYVDAAGAVLEDKILATCKADINAMDKECNFGAGAL